MTNLKTPWTYHDCGNPNIYDCNDEWMAELAGRDPAIGKLMAAAPELLEALIDVQLILNDSRADKYLIEQVQAAIDKATK